MPKPSTIGCVFIIALTLGAGMTISAAQQRQGCNQTRSCEPQAVQMASAATTRNDGLQGNSELSAQISPSAISDKELAVRPSDDSWRQWPSMTDF